MNAKEHDEWSRTQRAWVMGVVMDRLRVDERIVGERLRNATMRRQVGIQDRCIGYLKWIQRTNTYCVRTDTLPVNLVDDWRSEARKVRIVDPLSLRAITRCSGLLVVFLALCASSCSWTEFAGGLFGGAALLWMITATPWFDTRTVIGPDALSRGTRTRLADDDC